MHPRKRPSNDIYVQPCRIRRRGARSRWVSALHSTRHFSQMQHASGHEEAIQENERCIPTTEHHRTGRSADHAFSSKEKQSSGLGGHATNKTVDNCNDTNELMHHNIFYRSNSRTSSRNELTTETYRQHENKRLRGYLQQ